MNVLTAFYEHGKGIYTGILKTKQCQKTNFLHRLNIVSVHTNVSLEPEQIIAAEAKKL